jgi:hypothetical protein
MNKVFVGRDVVSADRRKIFPAPSLNMVSKVKGKGKCKATPLQAWTGPEGSRRLRLSDFKTIGI